jgi:putative oxidoreductase
MMSSSAAAPGCKTAGRAVVLIRLMVGGIFLAEGILKFIYPDEFAAGRFARIGIPFAEVTGPFVGGIEILCGTLVLLGWFTRLAALLLLINISVAILSTKIPVLLGHGFWGFSLTKAPHYGFLGMVHEARTDFSMWLGLVFLLIVGGGGCSLDHWRAHDPDPAEPGARGDPAAPVPAPEKKGDAI